MTQIERESLVERYLTGEMTVTEESDFFLHVAVDDELQRTLKAFRIMDQAIQNDCATAVARQSPYREQVFGLLAATHPIAGGAVASPAGSGAAGGASGALGIWKLAYLSMLAVVLAVGTWFVLPLFLGTTEPASVTREAEPGRLPGMVVPEASVPAPSLDAGGDHGAATELSPEARKPEARESAEPVRNTKGSSAGRKDAAVREAAREEAAGQDTAGEPYLHLPSKSPDEVKIPTDIEKTKP